jgi:hypothetical protein
MNDQPNERPNIYTILSGMARGRRGKSVPVGEGDHTCHVTPLNAGSTGEGIQHSAPIATNNKLARLTSFLWSTGSSQNLYKRSASNHPAITLLTKLNNL